MHDALGAMYVCSIPIVVVAMRGGSALPRRRVRGAGGILSCVATWRPTKGRTEADST